MKKSIWWVVGVVIVVLIVIAVSGSKSTETGPIKIGFIGPLSGDGAVYGEPIKNSIDLAVGEINKAGGVNGRPVQMIFEDGK